MLTLDSYTPLRHGLTNLFLWGSGLLIKSLHALSQLKILKESIPLFLGHRALGARTASEGVKRARRTDQFRCTWWNLSFPSKS